MIPFTQIMGDSSIKPIKEAQVSVHLKSKLIPIWKDIFGRLSNQFKFEYVRYRQLYLSTTNPIWRSEIKYHESLITSRLNQNLPKSLYFKGIRVFYRSPSESLEDGANTPLASKSLAFAIRDENHRKKQLGYKWCGTCMNVLTPDPKCVFCRLQQI